ncbi:MAG: aldehyde dehydrogenase family protein, partial [Pedobacter sp.]
AYISKSIWNDVKVGLLEALSEIKIGSVADFSNFVNAVIDEKAFDKITGYIKGATMDPEVEILAGGDYDKSEGYFISPVLLKVNDPFYVTMREEIFGPVLSLYVYDDETFDETLDTINSTSAYGLTGAIIANDRYVIEKACKVLRNAAGNFYINDKCTGAVVGQQAFGGARASGTNDKAGSMINLLRWVSPRVIKENFNPPKHYSYPFMKG